ncbi:MAG: alpha/beta hydrolase [Pseudomonadota bacterium]
MKSVSSMETEKLNLTIDGTSVRLACLRRDGMRKPLVCLHGFGSTKEDYVDLALRHEFQNRSLIFWDAPGCGASETSDPEALSIPFLVKVALAACDTLGIGKFHLSGHSMGGLTALLLARTAPERILSFLNIEGNLGPEDCFLSRQIVQYAAKTPEEFAQNFADRIRHRAEYGSALYAAALPMKVRAASFEPIFKSMVELSDNASLMRVLTGLSCPRCFIYGEQNRHLSYLSGLPEKGIEVIEIPHSGHFPMYSNPPALWSAMAKFLERHEQ